MLLGKIFRVTLYPVICYYCIYPRRFRKFINDSVVLIFVFVLLHPSTHSTYTHYIDCSMTLDFLTGSFKIFVFQYWNSLKPKWIFSIRKPIWKPIFDYIITDYLSIIYKQQYIFAIIIILLFYSLFRSMYFPFFISICWCCMEFQTSFDKTVTSHLAIFLLINIVLYQQSM